MIAEKKEMKTNPGRRTRSFPNSMLFPVNAVMPDFYDLQVRNCHTRMLLASTVIDTRKRFVKSPTPCLAVEATVARACAAIGDDPEYSAQAG
jgi:hypothetical protein